MIDKDKVMSNPLFWELVKLRQKQKQDQQLTERTRSSS